ncbi:MAG: molecular chaperone HtpG [Bacteroidales bacterium]|nr:molecular chaperone HtpG [Bacteroidales bacterium]MDY4174240.1 molecular chaperone HtpG [Bacteroidales bacterium]
MASGKIGVSTKDLFPIIKKFLYSDHDIFLREIVSNAVDATQKLKVLASNGEFKGELGDVKVRVTLDKEGKTITVSDNGIGMTAEEVEKYINQIAFSGAEEFLEKHKNDAATIIGHFGLGFYSAFMVSDRVEIVTKSYKEGAKAVRWSCTGEPEYTLEEAEKAERGTDIIMHISDEEKEFLEKNRLQELLNKYCKFLPVEIAFGKKTEWKDGKEQETSEDNIINDTTPAWVKKPADLKEEDYVKFYHQLYPMAEDPLFYIHLNVDYPFTLTGILYFPKIKNNIDINRNKIQLYCNQVFVTDTVEGIVPDFLTLLHGVIDSPDIPLNVSRSYLQSDGNVKKISSHITKKVADRLEEIFKNDRATFEKKWDDLKIFIEYGMLTDDKFFDRAQKFALLKDVDGKYFTFEEYKTLVKENQTDKDGTMVCLYAHDKASQFSFIDSAQKKGYNVLLLDGQLDTPFMNQLEQKWEKTRFARVDADTIDKLIVKNDAPELKISTAEKSNLEEVFRAETPKDDAKVNYTVSVEALGENELPVIITQNEWMRRMKEMSAVQGGAMSFYGELPNTLNLVVNANHPLVERVLAEMGTKTASELAPIADEMEKKEARKAELNKAKEGKKDEEIPQADIDELQSVEKQIGELRDKRNNVLANFAKDEKLVSQLIDLALLSNNMLKGESLTNFIKRSISLM